MKPLLLDFLGELERAEARLLAWALVDGCFAEDELRQQVEDFLDRRGWHEFTSVNQFIEAMVQHGLLFRWEDQGDYRFRTRMAETVRLLARLKQLFPQHLRTPGAWLSAPGLVSDFRFLLRPRQYPKRDQSPATWLPGWVNGPPRLSALQESVLHQLASQDLAGFQVRATARILSQAANTQPSGTVICAGTGSGKTIAFYLPALTLIAGSVERDESAWVRALAIYPRNELLKDQFSETLRQTRRLRELMTHRGNRPLTIGSFFGATPKDALSVQDSWHELNGGHVCPFLLCPQADCNGALIWQGTDRQMGIERLVCVACGSATQPDEVLLTRKRIAEQPPDVLFTTTEMMNQRMTDSRNWHLFGIGVPASRKPSLVLLDEAHTYNGTHGSQVAYLLRRWRHRSRAQPHFVGLSATLMEAASFFTQLTGLTAGQVLEVSPEPGEMISEGMEYMVALRGDPISGASLLSTSLQAAMLLRRVMEPNDKPQTTGAYGRKVFLFTDDLDVTNRMFFNLLDAEGQDACGRPNPQRHPGGSLANLRSTALLDEQRRFLHGQSWRMVEELHHILASGSYVRVGRVSSQDSGVDANAEVIVATASLEVGFNDPEVGAVLQHKAPREAAAFLQRKGRAGRLRCMRPWTVVVLSDFGRDRLTYQGYDLLFDPELQPRALPLANRHVLKMQSAYACLDWLAANLPRQNAGHVWQDTSVPGSYDAQRHRQAAMADLLERVLAGGDELQQLTQWLRLALRLNSEADVQPLLWEAPRALMTSVLPTLHRRLSTQWRRGTQVGAEYHAFNHPMPEFVPATLFSNLNLPEVKIFAALGRQDQDRESFNMAASSALREFAPGRVSRRFGIRHGLSRHWLPLDPDGPAEQAVRITDFCPDGSFEELGLFEFRDHNELRSIRVLRPHAIQVRNDAPRSVRDSSNAFPIWHSQLLPPEDNSAGVLMDLPGHSPWNAIIAEIRFFTHREFEPARVRRFTRGSSAGLQMEDGTTRELRSNFVLGQPDDTEAVALGFAFEADALRVRVQVPHDWRLNGSSAHAAKVPALRTARFRWRVQRDEVLGAATSVFERGWLADICLAAITATAVTDGATLEEAWQTVRSGRSELNLENVITVLFQSAPTIEEETGQQEQRRIQDLRSLLGDPNILAVLDALVSTLWQADTDDWTAWLRERFTATLAAALREAIQQLCPDVDAESLLVDLDTGEGAEIWISEDAPGGGGIIERLLPLLAESPQRFLDLVAGALGAGDFEIADQELSRFLDLSVGGGDPVLLDKLVNLRCAQTLEGTTAAFDELKAGLRMRGFHTNHAVVTALNSRLLKPGSTAQTDALVHRVLDRWRQEELRLGIEIEARPLAFALSGTDDLDQSLATDCLPIGADQDRRAWRMNAIYGLLWPRGTQARNHALSLHNPYTDMPAPERFLVLDALGSSNPVVRFGTPNWRAVCEQALVVTSRISLAAPDADLQAVQSALLSLLVTPLDAGSLLLHPRLRGIERGVNEWIAQLELVAPTQITQPPCGEDDSEDATSRLIVRTPRGEREEIRDLLESLLATELMLPGQELWLVSPWITDLPLLDNRTGGYSGLEPSWPKRRISLAEVLAYALRNSPQMMIRIITRPDVHNTRFCARLRHLTSLDGNEQRLSIDDKRENLHTKGLAGSRFAFIGSMNFTHNGIEVLEETVQLETQPARVAQFLVNLHGHYGF